MKDASGQKRSRSNSDLEENDSKRSSDPKEKTDKQKRKKLRKRRSSSSPEEDIIDGFVIASYSTLRSLEVVSSNSPDSLPLLDNIKNDEPVNITNRTEENEKEATRPSNKSNEEISDVKTDKNVEVKEVTNGNASHTEIDLSRQSPGQMTDDSSESGNSGKGYICDGESEDDQVPEETKTKLSLSSVTGTAKEAIPIKVDLSKDDDEKPVKIEKSFIDFDRPKSISSPKSSSFQTPSLSFSTPSSTTIPHSSHSISQSSWLPRFSSSSFKKPLATIEPCCGSGSYSGTDALHQELNNRFLQSHSELERNSQHSKLNHEMHQHSHLHHHQHQHQHTHYYPSPLLASPFFPNPSPVPGLLSQFSTPVPPYGSHIVSPYNKKTGKWCAAHVQIAWKIYCQQKVQGEASKDLHAKPEGISSNQPNTPIIPPFPARHGTPGDLGYHSSHLHSRRFTGSPFGRPPVLIPRSSSSTTTMTSSSISAFSSVSSPPLTVRRMSPVAAPRTSSETHGKRSPSSGPSTLYPWLKSEPKTPELDSEKTRENCRREFLNKSPARPSNFSVQALASDRTEIRPTPLRDSTRTHSSREHRPFETRSFLDSPLVPSLGSLEKRPIDYRPSTGSIDLNRNSLYPRYEPMNAMYPHHVTPITPHITGYPYPSSSFLADYHPPPAHPMILGPRDPMTSLVRTSDAPFYIRHDFDDRLSGRH